MAKKISNRDEFSDETKKLAGDRVNLLCSICQRPTKAASAESSRAVSNVGTAAHICAASPNGSRYDPNMTVEQRKSIENCIWLCAIHGRLIDEDVKIYTKDALISKKKETEALVAKALDEGIRCFAVIKDGGFNIAKTKDLFNETVINGDFLKLKLLLESMQSTSSDEPFQDLHDYFSIVYAYYCDRSNLTNMLAKYVAKQNKSYINELSQLFTQYDEAECLGQVITLCSDERITKIAKHVIDGTIEGELVIFKSLDDEDAEAKIATVTQGSLLHKLVTNYALEKGISSLKNIDGSDVPLFEDEFLYKQKKDVLLLSHNAMKYYYVKEQKVESFEEYNRFLQNLDKIKLLASEIQMQFWIRLLLVSSNLKDDSAFERLYAECSEEIRKDIKISEVVVYNRILSDIDAVEFSEVKRICDYKNSYELADAYLSRFIEVNPNEAEKIISNHKFLFSQSSSFLNTYIRLKGEIRKATNFSPLKFLEEYKDRYKDDATYQTMLAFYSSKKSKSKSTFARAVKWLEANIYKGIESNNLEMLIIVCSRAKKYDLLLRINKMSISAFHRLKIASVLQNTQDISWTAEAKKIYLEILSAGDDIDGVYRSISRCCYTLGDLNAAKEYTKKEISLFPKKEDYMNLLQLRYQTKEVIFDEYLEKAKQFNDPKLDHLIGVCYLQKDDRENARFYLLRSLLVDDTNQECLNAYFNSILGGEKEVNPKKVAADVAVALKKDDKVVLIAIHDDKLISGKGNNKFANCVHYSETDKAVEDLLMAKKGDRVEYKDITYEIINIECNEAVFCRFAMAEMQRDKRSTAIYGNSTEKLIENLTEVLKKQNKEQDDIIKKYNESGMPWPTTFLTTCLGRGYLQIYEFFMHHNKRKIRNLNSNLDIKDDTVFVLSFDALNLLMNLNINMEQIKDRCIIPAITKRTIIKEIDEFIVEDKSDRRAGTALLIDGRLVFDQKDDRRKKASLKYFNSFKRFVEAFSCEQVECAYAIDNEVKKALIMHTLYFESDVLGCVQSATNRVLVTDDQFLAAVVCMDKTPAIGMNSLLCQLDLDISTYLKCIEQLAKLNFGNYLTQDVYEHIKKKITADTDETRLNEHVGAFWKLLTSAFLDEGSELWLHNNAVVRELAMQNQVGSGEPENFKELLLRANVHNFAKERPEEYKARLDEIYRKFRSRIINENGELFLETWIEEDDE